MTLIAHVFFFLVWDLDCPSESYLLSLFFSTIKHSFRALIWISLLLSPNFFLSEMHRCSIQALHDFSYRIWCTQ